MALLLNILNEYVHNLFVFILQRNVDNTYQGGKLNIYSVLQLWNLALQLYLEKLKEGKTQRLNPLDSSFELM